MNMSGRPKQKACVLDAARVVSALMYEINAAGARGFSEKQFVLFTEID